MEPHWRGWVRVGAAGHTATEHPITPPRLPLPSPPPREDGPWLEKSSSVNDKEAVMSHAGEVGLFVL